MIHRMKRSGSFRALATQVCLMLLACCTPATGADEKSRDLDGSWSIVSVELAGQAVEGLAGAELTFAGGVKSLKLPGGAIEKGTYTLASAPTPKQIDSTTDEKPGVEKGIYAVEGDTLKLCLATAGGPRPAEFRTRKGSDAILIVLKRAGAGRAAPAPPAREPPAPEPRVAQDPPSGTRAFRMGFTGFVYDFTPQAVEASRKFCRENGDILAHHIEGVPWAEALSGEPFPEALLDDWAGKKLATPANGKVYLAISPGRGNLKLAEKAGPLPKALVGKAYDDPQVIKAYLNYCRRAIEFFKPDYLAIGIEVNEIQREGAARWDAYVALHRHVYTELKKEHKDLPIFASWTLHAMFQHRGKMLEGFKKLMPYNDIVAVSYYPFFVPEKDRLSALDWMTAEFDGFAKPYAMVETNDAAERLPLPKAKVVIEGTPAKQAEYYRALLGLAQKRKFAFVISFVHHDYDALWEKIKAQSPELFMAWRDCGLLDESGKPRPAYDVWRQYFLLPLQ